MASENDQLKQAQALIKEKEYDQAAEILQAMPDNPTAQQWLARIDALSAERDQLLQAQALIKAKQYDEARAILQSMGANPQAQQWLAQLDEIAPTKATASPSPGPLPDVSREPQRSQPAQTDQLQAQLGEVGKQAQERLVQMGVDLNTGLVVVILATAAAILAALLDAILGLPGGLIDFAFGWIVVALTAPAYAIIKREIKLDGLIVSAAMGFFTALVWYIVASILMGEPDVNDYRNNATHAIYKGWVDDMSIIDAPITGIVIGLVSFGWVALLSMVPERLRAFLPKL